MAMMLATEESRIDLHEIGLIWYGGPLALILTGKNHFKLRKIERMREFFINEYGVYEVDSETEYRYGKQPISIYNSHGTRIPKKIVNRVKKHYRQRKNMEIRRDLEQIYPKLKEQTFRNIYEVFQYIVEQNQHRAIDIDTEKFLPFYRAYNPISIKRLNEVCQIGRKAIDSLHPNLKPPMPIIFAIVGGIIGLAVIQNGPKYMREIGSYFEDLRGKPEPVPAPVPVQEVEIVEAPAEIPLNETAEVIEPVIEQNPSFNVEFILQLWNSVEPMQFISHLLSFL